jgi:hypothetical protein
MNTLKKIGLTALATSMVASSAAYSADAVVSGSFGYTFATEGGNTGGDSRGIGMRNKLNFNFSGEMDNGWSVSANTALLPGNFATSSQSLYMTMGSMGSIVVGNGWGGIGAGFDAVTPTAYEEAHDGFATASTLDSMGTGIDNGNIVYYSPSIDLGGMTVSAEYEYAPKANDTYVSDGGTAGASDTYADGQGAAIRISGMGISAGAYANEVTRDTAATTDNDATDMTYFVNYTMGSVSLGYQKGYIDRGNASATSALTAAKAVAASAGFFEAEQMSIAFNVNDNLTTSYTDQSDTYDAQSESVTGDVDMDTDSLNIAYTVGSMSIAIVDSDQDNVGWDSDAGSASRQELSVRLAF